MRAIPLMVSPGEMAVNGFFYRFSGRSFLVTNRHNVTRHQTRITSFGRTVTGRRGRNYRDLRIFDPGYFPFDPENAPSKEELTLETIDLVETRVLHDERWDIALIELEEFEPERHEFEVFTDTLEPAPETPVKMDCFHPGGTHYVWDIEKHGLTGEVTDTINPVELGDNRYALSNLSEKIGQGSSGAPVYNDNKLVGVYSAQYFISKSELPTLDRSYYYAVFESAEAIGKLPVKS